MQPLLLVCAGSVHADAGVRDLFMAEPYAWGKQWQMWDEWFFWHLLHSDGLCESHLAHHCCCSLIRSNYQTVNTPGEHGGLCSALPGCPLAELLFSHSPPFKSIFLYFFLTHIKGVKGEKCQQLISRLVLKICFSMLNVRICVHPFKRWNKANELAVQETWFCTRPWRDRGTGTRGDIITKHLFAEYLSSLPTLWWWGVSLFCAEQAQNRFRMVLKCTFNFKLVPLFLQ